MATLITKNSSTASSVPTAAQLVQGELAVNVTDKRLFTENSSGTVVELGTNPSTLALPNGTANGVAYLNGSKVLTTGSALTFDGTNLALTTAGAIYKVPTAGGSLFDAGGNNGIYVQGTPSGLLGFYASGSEQMRLTSTGLGIGTSSPGARVHAYSGTSMAQLTVDGAGAIRTGVNFASSGTTYGQIYFDNNSPYDMSVVQQYTTGSLIFGTNSTERARITSGGDLLVGTTAAIASERFNVTGSVATNFVMRLSNSTATSPQGMTIFYSGASPNSSSAPFLYCYDTTTLRAEIRSNGGLANYSANDVNLSDRREKTNFAPAKSYLDTICAIPVQTFNYIDQSEDDPGLTLGVVAQDVQAVAPELVMESNWGTEDNPKMRLSIYQTDLQYALMKALQELKAEFDAYKATHP